MTRYATKCNLCFGAAGAALWAAVFLLPAYPRAMPLSAFEAVVDAEKSTRPARPVELPPLRRKEGNQPGADREAFDCLAVNLFSRAQCQLSVARIAVASLTQGGLGHQRFAMRPCDVAGSQAPPHQRAAGTKEKSKGNAR